MKINVVRYSIKPYVFTVKCVVLGTPDWYNQADEINFNKLLS